MKKIISLFAVTVALLLGGCSLIGEVNDSLNYAGEAVEYMNELSAFTESVRGTVEGTASNPELNEELENQLTSLKENAEEFNNLEAPAMAESIHQELISKNQVLLDSINQAIASGNNIVQALQETELMSTIQEIVELRSQIEQLSGN